MKKNIKILDCTLRDGGYVNNWNFGFYNIQKIIKNLNDSNVDFIECGFMQNGKYSDNYTLYNSIDNLLKIIPPEVSYKKIVAMIDYGDFDCKKLPDASENSIFGFRFIFKKNYEKEALKSCLELKKKGYNLFINPTFINQYSYDELLSIIEKINKIEPYAFSIVDSMGVLRVSDAKMLFNLADINLSKNISLCFHSHNNLQLSFSNAKELIELNSTRNIIVDTSIFGMGRGAGNIKTEFLIQYLNENYQKNYKILPVLFLIQNLINEIFEKKPWGYSVPYYLAAQSFCHPNYATFLIDKKLSLEVIDNILKQIPNENKICFDKNVIEKLYKELCEQIVC